MNQTELAILALARAKGAVLEVSAGIRAALQSCLESQSDLQELPDTHLKAAYAHHYDSDDDGEGVFVFDNHHYDVAGYLESVCPHCLQAHNLVQKRKQARQELGIAKRRIAIMGNHLLTRATTPERHAMTDVELTALHDKMGGKPVQPTFNESKLRGKP